MMHIVCYSGGHSSALAAIETVRHYGKENVILLNHNLCPRSEHADIKRFKQEVADYLGLPITYANMPGYEDKDQFDVCVSLGTIFAGRPGKALCTNKLKTEPFTAWLAENSPVARGGMRDDVVVVYGFDSNETVRITRRAGIMAAMGYKTEYPLYEGERSIFSTEEIGIDRPMTYEIFNHANCIGCLKAGKQHWFTVYCLYPDVWTKAKWAEEQIGYSILPQSYLKDIEAEFADLKAKGLPATEKIKPQKFWAIARRLVADDDQLPCECSF